MAMLKSKPAASTGPKVELDVQNVFEFARRHGISTKPLDIEEVIRKLGIKLLREDLDPDISGYIEKRWNSYVISVNKYHNERRQRFTMAHELGHFFLHRDRIDRADFHPEAVLFRDNKQDPSEIAANQYASELLMPEDEYRAMVRSGVKSIESIARAFDVSVAAARYRAYKLGYIRRY